MNSPHLQRAWMLLDQSRHEQAETELRQALAHEPNHSQAHALLAICLSKREAFAEATREAEQAIHLAPDQPFPHYVLSVVMSDRNRYPEAERAILEAISSDPFQPSFFAQLSQVNIAQRRWQEALDAADQGLQIDPEDTSCTNLRAMALVKLGRKMEAGDAIQVALQRQPDDAVTHANQGWTLIEQGQHEKAMEHFREALRIDPTLDWARQGIVEALKAKYFIYRIILSYFLWMTKLSSQARWGVLIGGYIGYTLLRSVARNNPALSPWITPLLIVYIAFAIMTWIANPLFNLLLRLNRFGRLALSREQIITSNWVGACVVCALLALITYFASGFEAGLFLALTCGLVIPPLSAIFSCQPGWPRTAMILVTVALASCGFLSASLIFAAEVLPEDAAGFFGGLGVLSFRLFVFGAIASQFAANALASAVPRR